LKEITETNLNDSSGQYQETLWSLWFSFEGFPSIFVGETKLSAVFTFDNPSSQHQAIKMSEYRTEIFPETNKVFRTKFTFRIDNFLSKLGFVSHYDFEIPGLTTW
jgi:hypothetical protein